MIQMYSGAAKRAGVLAGGAVASSLIALMGKRLLARYSRA